MTLLPGRDAHHSYHTLSAGGWGSDDDAGHEQPASEPTTTSTRSRQHNGAARTVGSGAAVSETRTARRKQAAVPSLQALCVESLAEILPELLEVGELVVPFLPPHCKAALLAHAKRQDLVDDRALRLLVDADWSVLDASGCTRLTDAGLLTVLRLTPDVRWLDVTCCLTGAAVLRALPGLCPRISVLRIGGNATADQAANSALRHIAPQIQHPDAAHESWEQAVAGGQAAVDVSDRLTQLTHVVWPAIPERLRQRFALQCPKLQINACKLSAAGARKGPPEADLSLALDALFLDSWGLTPVQHMTEQHVAGAVAVQLSAGPLSIAERFRKAYEERDLQETARAMNALRQAARNDAQRKRRALRQAGSATLEVQRLLYQDW